MGQHDKKIRFKDIFAQSFTPEAPETKEYPENSAEAPVYERTPRLDSMGEVKTYIYVLKCPICGKKVKRSDKYCSECGNKLGGDHDSK